MVKNMDEDYVRERGIERGDLVEVTDLDSGFTFPGYFSVISEGLVNIIVPYPVTDGREIPIYRNCPFDRGKDLDIRLF